MLIDAAGRAVRGERPRLEDLVLTPANVLKATEQLAQLRGAAMKMGQLISMDAGDVLPPELAAIMARLRADAEPMPRRQLQSVLDGAWGRGWEKRFDLFDHRPIAAASIGQVHRALTTDGRLLAIKVQYPGVARSIDSDVDNVSTLLRVSGIVPKQLDIAPLLAEAKRQLHEEADYEREAGCMERFGELLAGETDYLVPEVHRDLSGPTVLAMTFVDSVPIETVETAPQEARNRIARLLIDLSLRELFSFQLMQTDPNLANYRFEPASGRIVLLDFGATRAFAPQLAEECRRLGSAGMASDWPAARQALTEIGLIDASVPKRHQDNVMAMVEMVMEPLQRADIFDFGNRAIVETMREQSIAFAAERDGWRLPPVDTLFLQRKYGGTYLLAARLRAKVDVKALFARYF
ncbi:AarF/ABC1/UbiB kinase family protein [Jiella sp. KSK16Y-1]|uniref:AarF/ABC1/UbiB kinase family protein n=2 Tax=Jiella mangrovi TaxID=2821407 RepID=A0ABS4BJW7_9HYPH|nr:AarF/ABC1/UbiB kinase family protein [Jiella mangrovi]